MNTDADFEQNYAINEEVLSSPSTDSNSKVTAWRQQGVILQHCLRNTSNATFSAVMEQHYKKLDYNVYDDFLKQRARRVEDLLKDAPIVAAEPIEDSILFAELEEVRELVEAGCHGVFESCVNDEITEDHLKKLSEANKTVPALSREPEVQPTSDLKRPTETTSANKTLHAYFGSSRTVAVNDSQRVRKKPESKQEIPTDTVMEPSSSHGFRTAREELMVQNMKKYGNANGRTSSAVSTPLFNYGALKKSLGARRTVNSGFVPPILRDECSALTAVRGSPSSLPSTPTSTPPDPAEPIDERLVNIDPKMIELISHEIMHKNQSVDWSDIAGLDYAKSIIKEAVVYPLLRPDIFTGLRRPPRGILLFGPPGTGKTLIGKCIASQSKSTFFSISASSLTSKWVGEGEKMVRALFAVAAVHQPAVVFIDEIDSLLTQRSESEHESSRRLKTEFLVQLDGAATSDDDRILIVGATNRPQELDEAARRRLVRRLYIPLPELPARIEILTNLLQTVRHSLNSMEIEEVGNMTSGYSGADMESLCREASMEPIRSIPAEQIVLVDVENLRPIGMQDFRVALQSVRPSVSQDDLKQYTEWNSIYGAGK